MECAGRAGAATALSGGRGRDVVRKISVRAKAVSRCACHRNPRHAGAMAGRNSRTERQPQRGDIFVEPRINEPFKLRQERNRPPRLPRRNEVKAGRGWGRGWRGWLQRFRSGRSCGQPQRGCSLQPSVDAWRLRWGTGKMKTTLKELKKQTAKYAEFTNGFQVVIFAWFVWFAVEKRWRATAVQDAGAFTMTLVKREASWSAPALWRFGGRCGGGFDSTPSKLMNFFWRFFWVGAGGPSGTDRLSGADRQPGAGGFEDRWDSRTERGETGNAGKDCAFRANS